ncbi:MAG: hypothetical protein KBB10_06055 [Clostridia bacterium]|nr:hypothetical protein [Clostridia bacterium]
MKLFHRHLYLFENYSQISRYNVTDFSQSKELREQDIVMYVMKNKFDEIIYRFVIADTDINALFSFFDEDKYKEYELKYILRNNQIKDIINGKETYSIPSEAIEDIKETYEELLKKDISRADDFFINIRLFEAEYELDDKERSLYIHEYDLNIEKIKEMIETYKEVGWEKEEAITFCWSYLKQIGHSYDYYIFNPIEKFDAEKSYDYINSVTFNRLDDKQKEQIKNYYENLDKIYEYHLTTVNDKVDEACKIFTNFKERNEENY